MIQKIVLTAFGTSGDMNPTIELARAIRREGMEPLLIINEGYKELAEKENIEAFFYGPKVSVSEMIKANPKFMAWNAGPTIIKEIYVPLTESLYRTTLEVIERTAASAVISHPLSFGSMWAAKDAGVKSACFHLAPISCFSRHFPDIFTPPKRVLYRMLLPLLLKAYNRWLKPACQNTGKEWNRQILKSTVFNQDLVLGLWDKNFGNIPEDPSANFRICGYPLTEASELDNRELKDFLSKGEAPVVLALGTSAVNIAGNFFEIFIKSCVKCNRRAVLFTGNERLNNLPETVFQLPSAPYSAVFPHASAIVHHGGAGTTSEALRSGKPSVVVPFAHDQFDNAERVQYIRSGTTLNRFRFSVSSLEKSLKKVLSSKDILLGSRETGDRIKSHGNGADRAAELIKDLIS